jgi:radical SAM protein with 4Fe4S-binding SPASM domain
MADIHGIDSHKLMYHPGRVAEWLECHDTWEKAKSVYPIYIEMSPFGACNHRCVFCAVDYIGYKARSLDENIISERIVEMAGLGVKAMNFAGEGEPSLWRPLPEILDKCTAAGIDTSMTTNMVPFNERNIDSFVRNCSWIKTSINAGTPETYSKIHRTKPEDFDRVLDNFGMCVETRKSRGYTCTVGAQMLLLPDNAHEAFALGEKLKSAGVDYLVIKPYSQHHRSITRKYEGTDYRPFLELERELQALNGDGFDVIFRIRPIKKLLDPGRGYDKCLATPFLWAHIMADGNVYGCSSYMGDERFCYGNIHELTFKDIWEGPERKENYVYIRDKMDIVECRRNCRMDEINRYLWRLTHPDRHVNFI